MLVLLSGLEEGGGRGVSRLVPELPGRASRKLL